MNQKIVQSIMKLRNIIKKLKKFEIKVLRKKKMKFQARVQKYNKMIKQILKMISNYKKIN